MPYFTQHTSNSRTTMHYSKCTMNNPIVWIVPRWHCWQFAYTSIRGRISEIQYLTDVETLKSIGQMSAGIHKKLATTYVFIITLPLLVWWGDRHILPNTIRRDGFLIARCNATHYENIRNYMQVSQCMFSSGVIAIAITTSVKRCQTYSEVLTRQGRVSGVYAKHWWKKKTWDWRVR